MGTSVLVMSQKYRLIPPRVRVNCTGLIVCRLRTNGDLGATIEGNSALDDSKTLRALYDKATSVPYGFLFTDLLQNDLGQTFSSSLEGRLIPGRGSNQS